MKFKNSNLIFVLTDRRMDGRTSKKQYAPSIFSKLGGGITTTSNDRRCESRPIDVNV